MELFKRISNWADSKCAIQGVNLLKFKPCLAHSLSAHFDIPLKIVIVCVKFVSWQYHWKTLQNMSSLLEYLQTQKLGPFVKSSPE